MSATVNKLVYGDLTFTDDEIQDGEVYDAVALLSDTLESAPSTWDYISETRRRRGPDRFPAE
mgnify:CR=1 FL=1